jgi:predicted enzyme related to lactoylglutathione lyase
MRNTIRALFIAAIFVAGQINAATPKQDVGPGRATWFDISTSSLTRAKAFYGELFEWKFTSLHGTNYAVEIVADGKPIGTLRVAEGAISAFNGVIYIQVTDMLASCKKAKALGGTVVDGFPFDLRDGGGAVALVIDPTGHPIGMYSRDPLPPAPSTIK